MEENRMSNPRYIIRPMIRGEIDLCIRWAEAEGWNPGLYDAEAFYAADSEGFWVGLLDGEPIATISAVRYGSDFGFIGFYIVRPDYRGQGYGLDLWKAAMRHLQGRLIGLDGVVAQQANYQKSGFQLAYNNVRYQGVAGQSSASAPGGSSVTHGQVLAASDLPGAMIHAYDRHFFPGFRERFLSAWITQPKVVARVMVVNGVICGLAVIRPCVNGYKIGPLFADDDSVALQLFDALVDTVEPGAQIQIDIPAINPRARALAQRHGMTPVFETARMYTGSAPDLDIARMYGITSFELG